jgi:hypothetical protein
MLLCDASHELETSANYTAIGSIMTSDPSSSCQVSIAGTFAAWNVPAPETLFPGPVSLGRSLSRCV